MARGSAEKAEVEKKIYEMFPGAFSDGKAIRVPIGEVEIKIALSCAKDVLGGAAAQGDAVQSAGPVVSGGSEPDAKEIAQAKNLLKSLGL